MRSINAGNHVLVEKAIADSAEEAKNVFAFAEERGVVVLEAIHFTFAFQILPYFGYHD